MKMSKSEKEALLGSMKGIIQKAVVKSVIKATPQAGGDPDNPNINTDSVVDIKPEHVSLVKYIKGGLFDVRLGKDAWAGAESEYRLFKALGRDDPTRGGFLVPQPVIGPTIELLREQAMVRNMPGVPPAVTVNASGKMEFPNQEAASIISWGSEASTITEDETLAFGHKTLEVKKAVALYKLTREIMNAGIGMDAFLSADLARSMAEEEDRVFLSGTGGVRPLGFFFEPRVNSTDLSGALSIDNLLDARLQVRNAKSEVTGWIGNTRTENAIAQLKDAEGRYLNGLNFGNGQIPKLWGVDARWTTLVPIGAFPGSSETFMVGGRWSDLVIGEGQGIRIETSAERYFENDVIGLRLVKEVGMLLRHPDSFVVIKGITE